MSLLSFLIDGVFPPLCCNCKKIGSLLCPKCYEQLEFDSHVFRLDSVNSLRSATKYGVVSTAIVHTLKYQSVKPAAVLCAKLIYMSSTMPHCDIITAVPLHPARLAQRGFNQAELIAIELAKNLNIPYLPLLIRSKETINFAKIKDKDQRQNLSINLFDINAKYLEYIANSSILLIDDVWTTGSTIEGCAQVLAKNSVSTISALTFTHGI